MVAETVDKPGACILRPARLDDLDQLAAIDAVCFPAGIAYPRHYLLELLRSPACVARVALMPADPHKVADKDASTDKNAESQQIVGFAILEVRRRGAAVTGELITIDVLASVRQRGVGQTLHASVERAVQHRNGRRIRLQVSVENDAAIRFYEQLGYRRRGRIPRYYLGKTDAWWMEKTWDA